MLERRFDAHLNQAEFTRLARVRMLTLALITALWVQPAAAQEPPIDMTQQGLNIATSTIVDPHFPSQPEFDIEINGPIILAMLYWAGVDTDSPPGDAEMLFGPSGDMLSYTGALLADPLDDVFQYAAEVTEAIRDEYNDPGSYQFRLDDGDPGSNADALISAHLVVFYRDAADPNYYQVVLSQEVAYQITGQSTPDIPPVSFSYPADSSDRQGEFWFVGGGFLSQGVVLEVSDNPDIPVADIIGSGVLGDETYEIEIPAHKTQTTAELVFGANPSGFHWWALQILRLEVADPGFGKGLQLISTDPLGNPTRAWNPELSKNGRYVIITSEVQLVPCWPGQTIHCDNNNHPDVYLYDRNQKVFELISVNSSGLVGNAPSGPPRDRSGGTWHPPTISDDGCVVLFLSEADNLAPNDTNEDEENFVRKRCDAGGNPIINGTTEFAAINPAGSGWEYANAAQYATTGQSDLSSDGRYVVFKARAAVGGITFPCDPSLGGDFQWCNYLYRYDLQTQTTEMVSVSQTGETPNWDSQYPNISADGRWVAFASGANNLVPGVYDPTHSSDVFLKDMQTGAVMHVSRDTLGNAASTTARRAMAISGDGRYVVFTSESTLMTPEAQAGTFLWDRDTIDPGTGYPKITLVSSGLPQLGDDGRSARPEISDNGKFVVFQSNTSNLNPPDDSGRFQVYVHNTHSGATKLVSINGTRKGEARSKNVAISGDGTWIAFESHVVNWIPNDTIFPKIWMTRNPLKPRCGLGFELVLLTPLLLIRRNKRRDAARS